MANDIKKNDYGKNEQISHRGDKAEKKFRSILAEASVVSFRTFETIQELTGTTVCKRGQIAALRTFAIENDCWYADASVFGEFSDRGSENEVYSPIDQEIVYKLNDFRYADDNLNSFFERIEAHNLYFPDCAYDLIGFALNRDNQICAVLEQPFIRAKREATIEEITVSLKQSGFLPQLDGEYFSNGEYDIFDAVPNNVLYGIDDHLYFIDTIIYKSEDHGFSIYKSLSPHYKK